VEVQLHVFLTSTLDGGEWSASRPGRFTPGVRAPGTHLIGGCEDPRASLDAVAKRKNPIIEFPGSITLVVQPVAQSLSWLTYRVIQLEISHSFVLFTDIVMLFPASRLERIFPVRCISLRGLKSRLGGDNAKSQGMTYKTIPNIYLNN
jgi:hypothetical protein